MRRLRKTATALLVWATAVSSLIGSTPHFTCRCPDGTVKPFCSGQTTPGSSCCCNGKCCSTSDGADCCCKGKSSPRQEEKNGPSCCHRSKTETPSKPAVSQPDEENAQKIGPDPRSGSEGRLVISRSCCQKSLVKAESRTLVRPETKPIGQVEFGLAPLPSLNVGYCNPSPLALWDGWRIYRLPPPTDLVVAFHHFII
jgi:hypothetical protein